MIDGVYDDPGHARELASFLTTHEAFKVNLSPYNPTDGGFEVSGPETIEAFRAELVRRGVPATVRLTRGRDIAAACGQLAASNA
jgi:23S rRNA (adenine2503-C2)-methyltransferase